ncbi:MAG: S-layer homology domain-containing protein, partial [Clostridiaceae bacterium]|nr:S-layer homology domain-containing protein [Clostridiaceae bacterium]
RNAGIEAVEAGDSAYIKLDDQGNIEKISAVDNYSLKFGTVMSKKSLTLSVRYDDGGYQFFDINEGLPVILDGAAVGYKDLKDGDRVRLLINATGNSTELKQITIEGSEHFIANIYKGMVKDIDNRLDKLVVQNLEVLKNGKWIRTEQNGLKTVSLSEEGTILKSNTEIDRNSVTSLIRNHEAYIAVEKDYGGEEKAVLVVVKDNDDVEVPVLDDSISSNAAGNTGNIKLDKAYKNIAYDNGTIIVKNSRLVSGSSIGTGDQAYVVANRDYNGDYYASVVEINERSDPDFFKVYRARISAINEFNDFTVNSFSELSGLKWDYYNTPKSFRLTGNTQILDGNGVVGQRNFTDTGDASYEDRTVYVVAKGLDAELISTVPYGNINVKGEIHEISGGTTDEYGGQETTGIRLVNAKIYNNSDYIWEDSKDMSLTILVNSIILKNNRIVKPSELEKGDNIRVVKKDTGKTGEAYIIFVE